MPWAPGWCPSVPCGTWQGCGPGQRSYAWRTARAHYLREYTVLWAPDSYRQAVCGCFFFFWCHVDQIITDAARPHDICLRVPRQSAACPVLLDVLTNCLGPGRASNRILNRGCFAGFYVRMVVTSKHACSHNNFAWNQLANTFATEAGGGFCVEGPTQTLTSFLSSPARCALCTRLNIPPRRGLGLLIVMVPRSTQRRGRGCAWARGYARARARVQVGGVVLKRTAE